MTKDEVKKGSKVQDEPIGQAVPPNDLYMVVWQRMANSGINYVYARSAEEAAKKVGFQEYGSEHVLATVAKIEAMPVEYGRVG